MGSMMSSAVSDDQAAKESYPHLDDDGNCMAYKEGGRWVNWWARNAPGGPTVMAGFAMGRDDSGIPRSKEELDSTLPVCKPSFANDDDAAASPAVRATWIGHATVLAEIGGTAVITDPIFSDRASMFSFAGPKRYRPPACEVRDLPENLSAVVISHSHYDHLDLRSCQDLNKRYGPRLHWFVPSGIGDWIVGNAGADRDNVHEMVWWQEERHPDTGARFVLTPSHHWGQRTATDRCKALWGSWAVFGPPERKGSFWFGGDTAYCEAFQQIGRKLGPFDLAAIPIGAYNPRHTMKWFHVDPDEAVRIHQDINSARSLAIHWGTFRLAYEPYLEPRTKLRKALEEAGIDPDDFQAPDIGQSVLSNKNEEFRN